MAYLNIAAVVVPEIYTTYGSVKSLEENLFVRSGIAKTHPQIQAALTSGGGQSVQMPYWDALAYTEPAGATDNPDTKISVGALTTSKDVAFKQPCTKALGATSLAIDWSGADPVGEFYDALEKYWETDLQRRVTYSVQGIILDSAANHDDDLVVDITAAAGEAVDADNKMSATSFINALATMGDRQSEIKAIAMHSMVYANLLLLNEIDFVRASDNDVMLPEYKGKRLLVDDGMYTETYGDPAKVKYTTILFAEGCFGMGTGMTGMQPLSYYKDEFGGNGAGTETVFSRRQWIVHPKGYSFDGDSIAANCPTLAELATADLWTRNAEDRKQIRLAAIISNG